nr:MAG TPA: hypothetical protein [Caudoviricetes sp.]
MIGYILILWNIVTSRKIIFYNINHINRESVS